jgi:tetratricopeptide (TPR) repeat protein
MKVILKRALSIAAVLLSVAACAKDKGAKAGAGDSLLAALPKGHVPINQPPAVPLSPEAQAILDSGNVAFRAGRHQEALALYERASKVMPDHPAPWFGTYMAARELKNTALADSALKMIRQRVPGIEGHPAPSDGQMRQLSPHGDGMPNLTSPHEQYSPHGTPAKPRTSS